MSLDWLGCGMPVAGAGRPDPRRDQPSGIEALDKCGVELEVNGRENC